MDEIFGGLFDFNGDGDTDNFEIAMGFGIMSDATHNFFGGEDDRGECEDEDSDRDDLFYDPLPDDDF